MAPVNTDNSTLAIFYTKASWHNLLAEAIAPFIKKAFDDGELKAYDIFFRDNQGDHVIIALIPQQQDSGLVKRFITYISGYMSLHESFTAPVHYPLPSFFMNYPNNTVCCDLYPEVISKSESQFSAIRRQMADAIITAFGEDEIDTDVIYTFFIYIQIGLIKAACAELTNAIAVSNDVLAFLNSQPGAEQTDNIDPSFQDNQEMIAEVVFDVWEEGNDDSELSWFDDWINACSIFIAGTDFNQSFLLLTHLAYDRLGLKGDRLFSELIRNVLQSIIRSQNQAMRSEK